jgi:hypothetical protein
LLSGDEVRRLLDALLRSADVSWEWE